MRVIVFGATGRTGRHVLGLALDRGHEVTAFGRSADSLDPEPGVSAFNGDVLDPSAVAAAVEGHDGAVVCLGSSGLRDSTTLAAGTANIVAAVDSHGVGRLVVLSAAGVGDSWAQIPWSSRLAFKTMLRNILADHRAQEATVERSAVRLDHRPLSRSHRQARDRRRHRHQDRSDEAHQPGRPRRLPRRPTHRRVAHPPSHLGDHLASEPILSTQDLAAIGRRRHNVSDLCLLTNRRRGWRDPTTCQLTARALSNSSTVSTVVSACPALRSCSCGSTSPLLRSKTLQCTM